MRSAKTSDVRVAELSCQHALLLRRRDGLVVIADLRRLRRAAGEHLSETHVVAKPGEERFGLGQEIARRHELAAQMTGEVGGSHECICAVDVGSPAQCETRPRQRVPLCEGP